MQHIKKLAHVSCQIDTAVYIPHFSDATDLPVKQAQNTAIIHIPLFFQLHVQSVTMFHELSF